MFAVRIFVFTAEAFLVTYTNFKTMTVHNALSVLAVCSACAVPTAVEVVTAYAVLRHVAVPATCAFFFEAVVVLSAYAVLRHGLRFELQNGHGKTFFSAS